jgi:hypothetical protein
MGKATAKAAKTVETVAEDYTTFGDDLLMFSDQLLDDAKWLVRLTRELRSIEQKWPKALQRVQGQEAERTLVEEAPELMERIRLYAEMASEELDFLLGHTQLSMPEVHPLN